MDETTRVIKEFYNNEVEAEWNRIAGRPEFLLTARFIDRYVKPGDKVLDIGGGPGRYSLYLAEKGCQVTLFDLSEENVKFATAKAAEMNLDLSAVAGDARQVDESFSQQFDHVLLMGPLYHLLEEADRKQAVTSALKLLKPGGTIFASFISSIAGIIYSMKCAPELIVHPVEAEYYKLFVEDKPFAGSAFTQAYFARQNEILPFMAQFSLEKLHFLGQEGISSPCEQNIMSQPKEIIDRWIDLCEQLCEREELLSWAEHLLYIGRKI